MYNRQSILFQLSAAVVAVVENRFRLSICTFYTYIMLNPTRMVLMEEGGDIVPHSAGKL